jgi:hypothetical protein
MEKHTFPLFDREKLNTFLAAGSNLDSLRGLFEYIPNDASAEESLVDCDIVDASFKEDEIGVTKTKQFLDRQTTPIVQVG